MVPRQIRGAHISAPGISLDLVFRWDEIETHSVFLHLRNTEISSVQTQAGAGEGRSPHITGQGRGELFNLTRGEQKYKIRQLTWSLAACTIWRNKNQTLGTCLVVQWLRLHSPLSSQGTRSHKHATTKSLHATTKEPAGRH